MLAAQFTKKRTWLVIPGIALACFFLAGTLGRPLHAAQAAPISKKLIKQGQNIFEHTPDKASQYVGSTLSCSDCHINGGTTEFAAPVNVAQLYPLQSKSAGRTLTLVDRIQRCFIRSENGKPVPADSPVMTALVAYITHLSQNEAKGQVPKGRGLVPVPELTGNPSRGASIYQAQCSMCHEANGEGIPGSFPPLWGPHSFNDGAGMYQIPKMAAFVLHNMPQSSPGSLTAQQAIDVAAYVHSQPRPKLDPANSKY